MCWFNYQLDFFANAAPDSSGYGEGQFYLGSTNVTTGIDSKAFFLVTLAVTNLPARYLTATATDPFGNTSEFSTNVYVPGGEGLEAPILGVSTSGGQVLLSWPSSTSSLFVSQTTTNLTPVIVWTGMTNTVADDGTNKHITIIPQPGDPARFYRLSTQ